MISSIFYFAETEQEYLDNFNRHQVKPYTIVFCKDTKSLWKNGIRYGGNTTSEITDQVDDIIDRTITPLLNQLNQAVADAGDAADAAEQRLTQISTQMDGAIEDLQNAIDAEKTRLDNKVAEINDDIETRIQSVLDDYQNLVDNFEDNVAEKIESLLDDAEWVQENIPQNEVTWDSNWDLNVDNRMQQAGYWDIDPETGEKTTKWSKLQQSVDSISTEVARVDESLSGDITAVSTQVQQTADSITSIASSVSNIDGRLSTAETSISQTPDAIVSAANAVTQNLNGNIATAKSEVIQKASEIVQTVTGVTVASDGTVTTSNADLSQQIADNGDAITQLRTDWSNANLDTKDVLEWMYSGLTTKAGESGTFNDLVSAATSGDHSAISNILSLVEKIPTYQVDPQTGEPLEDEHGNYIYATDSEGNIIYQTNPDGSYKYRAKSSLTSAVDSAISGIINDTNSDYASTQMLAALGNNFAAWNAAAAESGSSIEGIVTHDNFAGELKSVASEDWAQTGIAAKLRVPKYDEDGNIMTDDNGDPIYEEISDAIGSIQTRVSNIDGIENVTNTIDGRVGDALSTFEQQVTGQTASTTAVNKLGPALAGLVSKVTGDTSEADIVSKINGMSAGLITTANLDSAVAGLVAENANSSLKSSIYSKIDTAKNEARAGMVANSTEGAAAIFAKANAQGSEIQLSADKINFAGSVNFLDAVKAVDLEIENTLTVGDVKREVTLMLGAGDAAFRGNVYANSLTAGNVTGLHIVTSGNELQFINGDKTVGRFVIDGDGLLLFVLNSEGNEYKIDWDKWERIGASGGTNTTTHLYKILSSTLDFVTDRDVYYSSTTGKYYSDQAGTTLASGISGFEKLIDSVHSFLIDFRALNDAGVSGYEHRNWGQEYICVPSEKYTKVGYANGVRNTLAEVYHKVTISGTTLWISGYKNQAGYGILISNAITVSSVWQSYPNATLAATGVSKIVNSTGGTELKYCSLNSSITKYTGTSAVILRTSSNAATITNYSGS